MITLDLSILNQKGTPMFNSDIFANRPAAGIVGRVFIATDTFDIYRDNGTTWDQLGGGGGGGTIAGTIAAGQVAFGTALDTIGGNNNLFWDNAQLRLGIGTNTPAGSINVNTSDATLFLRNTSSLAYSGVNMSDDTNTLTGSFQIGGSGVSTYANNMFLGARKATGNLLFVNGVTPTTRAILFSTGNLVIGQTTDGGSRLFVAGNIGMTNFTTISSGNNSIGFESFRMQFRTAGNTLAGQFGFNFNADAASIITTGDTGKLQIASLFTPSSGNATYITTLINPQINQTGGANGITRGLYVASSITAAADYRSIEWNNNTGWGLYGFGTAPSYFAGNVQIGSTTPIASNINLQVTGLAHILDTRSYTSGTIQSFVTQRFTTINAAISASSGICNYVSTGDTTIQSSRTIPASTSFAGIYSFNKYAFASAALTLTAQQAAGNGIRTISQLQTQNVFKGANSGTMTDVSGIQIAGFYNENNTTITPVITNAYQLIINDTGAYGHTFSFTNRWGIYQEGINDRNYLAGNLLLNSTTDTGQILQVSGAIRVNGQQTASASGNSGNYLTINVDGTNYKLQLFNP